MRTSETNLIVSCARTDREEETEEITSEEDSMEGSEGTDSDETSLNL